ncbi:MAG: ABC transporter ATP-binding protein [Clostridiaceae bacterium]|nr:ABC transporter ATP-binding protein [Clostridiaceae bacterium]
MIRVSNLTKRYGKSVVLDNLSMNVPKGAVYGLVGPNGAGKTTLLKHLSGVFMQEEGECLIDGQNVYENPQIKKRMIFIPDDLYFFQTFNTEDMVKLYKNVYPKFNMERFLKLKEVFPIDTKKKISKLSKGMQKQVAFWLGICAMPDVLILDEPVDGLDPVMRRKVWNLIVQDITERNTTVVVSSHNLRELEDICDHVGILHGGKIIIEKALDDVKSDIHKVQVAFRQEFPQEISNELKVLHHQSIGSVNMLIIKGEMEKIREVMSKHDPLIFDIIPLSLEEVFIYEMGDKGYEITNVII